MKLLIGLGNQGKEFEDTRHNVGAMCLEYYDMYRKEIDKEVLLLLPMTPMSGTGAVVKELVIKFYLQLNNVLVIHDDLDLPVGKFSFQQWGGSAGHRGVQSIMDELGRSDFNRLGIGIGKGVDVLEGFTAEEFTVIVDLMPELTDAIQCYLDSGIIVAMSKYNRRRE